MSKSNTGNVIVVRRKKVVAGGHHGGAWKVAYADFVTAMMAFFLLMWLLSVSDEETRLGLADYFSPTVPIHSTVGGGDGPFEGSSVFAQTVLAKDGTGQAGAESDAGQPNESLFEIAEDLLGGSGDALEADPLLEHIATRVTDEGLIIDVFDVPGSPLFTEGSAEPNPIFDRLAAMIGRVLAATSNPVAVTGHLARDDYAGPADDAWGLTSDRAQIARKGLVAAGVTDDRLARVTGKADRSPATENPFESRNRRIEIVLLRSFDG